MVQKSQNNFWYELSYKDVNLIDDVTKNHTTVADNNMKEKQTATVKRLQTNTLLI